MILHTKYLDSRPCGFRQEDFFHVAAYLSLIKHVTPRVRPFLAPGL